jgi:DNA-binding transcriptional ArsR family regulator
MATARRVKQLDGGSVRALAHPLRVRIQGSLRADGPATATILAGRLGESSGATSYHLRVLADHGFVEEDRTRGTGRERWWRIAYEMLSWRSDRFEDEPDERAAEQWLAGHFARQAMGWIDDWQARRPAAPPAWRAAGEQSDYGADMTPDEVAALLAEVDAVVLRHVDASGEARADGTSADEGAEAEAEVRFVRFLVCALPAEEGAGWAS